MNQAHAALTLQAAQVAATALRSIHLLRPILGPGGGEARAFEEALDGLRTVYGHRPPPAVPPRLARLPKVPKPKIPRRASKRLEDAESVELEPSAWDPEPIYEASRCKAFLMEIIRRAASDWVQYRQARKMELRALAEQAYTWLFEEEPGHPAWKNRERALFKVEAEDGQSVIEVGSRRLTSFLSICEACGLNPDEVRARAREMTVESIMRTGRHTERRKPRSSADSMSIETHALVVDIDVESLDIENQLGSHDYYDSGHGYGMESAW